MAIRIGEAAAAFALAGIIASSHGSASVAPAPRKMVLREIGVWRPIIGFPPVLPFLQLYPSDNEMARSVRSRESAPATYIARLPANLRSDPPCMHQPATNRARAHNPAVSKSGAAEKPASAPAKLSSARPSPQSWSHPATRRGYRSAFPPLPFASAPARRNSPKRTPMDRSGYDSWRKPHSADAPRDAPAAFAARLRHDSLSATGRPLAAEAAACRAPSPESTCRAEPDWCDRDTTIPPAPRPCSKCPRDGCPP